MGDEYISWDMFSNIPEDSKTISKMMHKQFPLVRIFNSLEAIQDPSAMNNWVEKLCSPYVVRGIQDWIGSSCEQLGLTS